MITSLHRFLRTLAVTTLVTSLVLSGRAAIGASPANDNLAAAFEIPSVLAAIDTNLTGTLIGATFEPGEEQVPGLAAWNGRGTIWWKWTCPDAAWTVFLPIVPGTDSIAVGVYSGSSLTNLTTVVEINADPFGPAFEAETGVTYWFAVMMIPDSPAPAGPVSIVFSYYYSPPIVPITPPANDNFTNRIALVGTNVSVTSTNVGATTESGENVGPGYVLLVASVWYSWTAPAAGVVCFSGGATNPDFRFSLGTYRGETLTTLTVPAATADGGFYVEAGDAFQLQVASAYDPYWHRGGGTGFFTLNVHFVPRTPASSNDPFAQRLDITLPRYHFEGSIFGATNEPGEPLPNPAHRQTLWWRFIAPDDGLIQVSRRAPFANSVAVYEGDTFALMQRLTEASGSRFRVWHGREYSIQIASGPAPSGGFVMDTIFRSSSNDFFVGRERLSGTNILYVGNLTFATAEPGEPDSGASNTVWAAWTAPFTGRLTYSPFSFQSQHMNLFTGTNLAGLRPVNTAPSGSHSQVFLAVEGTEYQFQFSGAADDFTLSFQLDRFQPATNDDLANAEQLVGALFSCQPRSVEAATMEMGEPLHMGDIPQKSLWWKWRSPVHGTLSLNPGLSFVTNMVMTAYQGSSVESLRLVGNGTNRLDIPVTGGEVYYFAVAVESNATTDVMLAGGAWLIPEALVVSENLLHDPSFEGTDLLPPHWNFAGEAGGYYNEDGGCDGSTWPVLGTGTRLWQDIPTVPGHRYRTRFAFRVGGDLSGCCGDAGVRVLWDDQEIGVTGFSEAESGFWHSEDFYAVASNTTSRVTFENIHRNLEVDAFSVVDMSDPPAILTQPRSGSALAGGRVLFRIGVRGSPPLSYQWYFNGAPSPAQTGRFLIIESASPQDQGEYFVVVTNGFGMVTSLVATLSVESPTNATILVQPYGDTLPVGSYVNLSVVAAGLPPLNYQWFRDGQPISHATNRNLALANAQSSDSGGYEVRVQNGFSAVVSLPARLVLTNAANGGGMVDFANRFWPDWYATNVIPIFDFDGVTRLAGDSYRAQLYAGPSVELLRPVGQPMPFYTGSFSGTFYPQIVTLPNVPPGATAYLQVRAWESAKGNSYEEARVLCGKFGRSPVFTIVPGEMSGILPQTVGLRSFSLQVGLPQFNVGTIRFVERQAGDILVWAIDGEAGFRYLVEKTTGDVLWRPFVVLTNVTGQVTFTDTAVSEAAMSFYRARILD